MEKDIMEEKITVTQAEIKILKENIEKVRPIDEKEVIEMIIRMKKRWGII